MNITIQKDPRIISADAFSCLRIDERSVTVGENNIPAIAMLAPCNIVTSDEDVEYRLAPLLNEQDMVEYHRAS